MQYQVMPELAPEEYAELKADIQERGVMVPIEFDENGNILDGYNRLRICNELGITDFPKVIRAGMSEEQKLTHARKLNLARRHLTQEQKRELIRQQIKTTPERSDRQIADDLGVANATVSNQRHEMEKSGELFKLNSSIGADGKERPRQVKHTVSVFNPSARDADALRDPDIQRRMAETGTSVAGAIREQKRDKLVEHLESVAQRETEVPTGLYDCIVVDPPWPMQKIDRDERPNQTEFDYPTMSVEDIAKLEIPAADDCHVFLWTTQKFLPDALEILKAWGLKYVCTFVWHKPNGYKPFGLPIYNCEFVLYAHRGNPKFVDEKQFRVCNEWPTGGHSAKPEEFYEMLRRVTAGRRLDMFSRREIEGFDAWGKETDDGR